jgi:retron-type reverse transcriptase
LIPDSTLVALIHESTGLSESQIDRLIRRSPHTYKRYTIPKKSGGVRTIAQPAKETKFLQRWLMKNVFNALPLHTSATAYKTNSSIKINAAAHKENSYISKFDFKNFFFSINESDLIQHFTKYISNRFSENDIQLIARVSCIYDEQTKVRVLSIGSPSSPLLSNSVMFDFDCQLLTWCESNDFIYTRYADDLTFSTNTEGISFKLNAELNKVLANLIYPKISLNTQKTIHLSKKYQRRVTGLILTNENQISIGRDKKRKIRAMIHRYTFSKLSEDETHHLQGLLGFAKDIEPKFITSMRNKYGCETINSIFQIRNN